VIRSRLIIACCTGAACFFLAQRSSSAVDFKILYSFTGGSDGAYPQGSLIQSGSILYGMTKTGGNGPPFQGDGSVFAFDTVAGSLGVLHVFSGGSTDGAVPYGSLLLSNGTLFGMTNLGGANTNANGVRPYGTAFAFDLATQTQLLIHSFSDSPLDGASPQGSFIPSGNVLYAMTPGGGVSGLGTIFAIDQSTRTFTLLHSFTGAPADGKFPEGSLIQSGNLLYGMSQLGGSSNLGAIFSYDFSTNKQTLLHSFTGGITDGSSPHGSLLLSGTTLYGMTEFGGQNGQGAIFSYDLTTGAETVLHSFAGGPDDGANPLGSLIISGDTLYGMTINGGASPHSAGTVFSLDITTGQFTLLHSFDPDQHGGEDPMGDLLISGNTLYGMTNIGGANPYGAIFSITLPEPSSLALLTAGSAILVKRRRARG
jgi:uncharacterized repeat protein (TIGR03803 family)